MGRKRMISLLMGLAVLGLLAAAGLDLAIDRRASPEERDSVPAEDPMGPEKAVSMDRPLVIAHRAGAALGPENTLAALERSIAAGADIAEIDIHRTRDGALVAVHDSSLERTTGRNAEVALCDCDEVRGLDAGGWYSAEFAGEPIPTLEEAASAARGRIRLMVELKCEGPDRALVERTVDLLRRTGIERDCEVACSELENLKISKELAPEISTVYIGAVAGGELNTLDWLDGLSIQADGLTQEQAAQAKAAGKRIYAWTVNDREKMLRLLEMGVQGVVTDDPRLAGGLCRPGDIHEREILSRSHGAGPLF